MAEPFERIAKEYEIVAVEPRRGGERLSGEVMPARGAASRGRVKRVRRREAAHGKEIMQYLGRIAGEGVLTCNGEAVARVAYDFEGFSRPAAS